jgi:hypothetical protein
MQTLTRKVWPSRQSPKKQAVFRALEHNGYLVRQDYRNPHIYVVLASSKNFGCENWRTTQPIALLSLPVGKGIWKLVPHTDIKASGTPFTYLKRLLEAVGGQGLAILA